VSNDDDNNNNICTAVVTTVSQLVRVMLQMFSVTCFWWRIAGNAAFEHWNCAWWVAVWATGRGIWMLFILCALVEHIIYIMPTEESSLNVGHRTYWKGYYVGNSVKYSL